MDTYKGGFVGSEMKNRTDVIKFCVIYLGFLISAASVWLIPMSFDTKGNMNGMGYAAGAAFWAGLLCGILGYALCFRNMERPKMRHIFNNKPAIAADVVLAASLAVVIYSVFREVNEIIGLMAAFLLLTSLYSHFLLNGKVFFYIINEQKEEGELGTK